MQKNVATMATRSDSSAALRTHLKTNLASLPEISTKVSLNSYIRYCHNLYCGAKNAYSQGDLRRAYIDLYKFEVLALQKIPTHKDYKVKAYDTAKTKAWLENTKLPALQLLETVACMLDREEDLRLLHGQDFELMDEFDTPGTICDDHNPQRAPATVPPVPQDLSHAQLAAQLQALAMSSDMSLPVPVLLGTEASSAVRDNSVLSILSAPQLVSDQAAPSTGTALYVVPDFAFPDEAEDAAGATGAAPATSVIVGGLTADDKSILSCLGDRRRFSIPNPSTTTIDVLLGQSHHFFYQDDFHTSYGGFLAALPPELQLAKPAVEMNRCFFIHLGIALGIHPFALQCGFRRLASAALLTAEDWEKDILVSVTHYCGFVDANMLCLLWPLQLQSYRVCFVSGPLTRPLISVFQPPAPPAGSASEAAVAAAVEGLTEIVIRSSGDHFTLLRPLHAPAGFKVISQIMRDARAAGLVVQESQARPLSTDSGVEPRSIESVLT